MGQDCLPGTHLWWGRLSQFLASCPTTSRSTLTFLVSPSSWALTYSTGWDDGARKGVYDMSGVSSGVPVGTPTYLPMGAPEGTGISSNLVLELLHGLVAQWSPLRREFQILTRLEKIPWEGEFTLRIDS